MKFSEEALECGFFKTVKVIKDKYDQGNLSITEEGVQHITKKGTYIISESINNSIKFMGKKYNVKRVKEILLHINCIYDVGEFTKLWNKGALGRINLVNDALVLDCLKWIINNHPLTTDQLLHEEYTRVYKHIEARFGSLRNIYTLFGLDYDEVLLESTALYSSQGLIFENIVGEVLNKLGIENTPQHDIAGDGSTRIDYYIEKDNTGYECKLRDSTARRSESIEKYSPLLNKLYIVYAVDTGKGSPCKRDNVEFIDIRELLKLTKDEAFIKEIKERLSKLLTTEASDTVNKNCKRCGEEFSTIYTDKIYCSDSCRRKTYAKRSYNKRPKKPLKVYTGKCPECGKEFTTTSPDKVYCERKCGKRVWWRNNGNKYSKKKTTA